MAMSQTWSAAMSIDELDSGFRLNDWLVEPLQRKHNIRRWQLDYEGRPDEALAAFRRALEELPHDWRTRYRLARALEAVGRRDEARAPATHR